MFSKRPVIPFGLRELVLHVMKIIDENFSPTNRCVDPESVAIFVQHRLVLQPSNFCRHFIFRTSEVFDDGSCCARSLRCFLVHMDEITQVAIYAAEPTM